MTAHSRFFLASVGLLALGGAPALTAQSTKPTKPAPAAPAPKPAPASPTPTKPPPASVVPNQGKAPVTEVIVEVRADGLAYLPGAKQPFTGKATTASKVFEDCVESITPYKNGRLNGDVMALYKAGNPKTVRTYVDGAPKTFIGYYQDGAMKFQQSLNAKDNPEGPYKRWFPSGKLQAEATYDDEGRFHGDNKEYSENGKIKAHYVFDHGTIKRIVSETPAAKAEREAPPKPPAPVKK